MISMLKLMKSISMFDSVLMEIMSSKADSVYQPWLNDRLIKKGIKKPDDKNPYHDKKKNVIKQLKLDLRD